MSKRDVREETLNDNDEELGRLYIDEKHKEHGYVYRIVDADRAGRVRQLEKYGYEVVHDESVKVGQDTASNPSRLTTAVTLELGTNTPRNGILMRIPEELYRKRQEKKELKNKEMDAGLKSTGIPTQTGDITVGNTKL